MQITEIVKSYDKAIDRNLRGILLQESQFLLKNPETLIRDMHKLNLTGDVHARLPRKAQRYMSRVRPAMRTQTSRVSKHIAHGDGEMLCN